MTIYYGDGSNSGNGRLIKFDQTVLTSAATYDPNNDPSQDFSQVISLAVTPTDSSTVHYIHWSICFSINGGTTIGSRLYAGNSVIVLGDDNGNRPRVTTAQSVHQNQWFNQDVGFYKYDHNTSSQITYSIRSNTHDGRAFAVNRSYEDSNSNYMDNARCCSFLNVMEFSA
tara:strand:- start:241 stop:750 length:510 start_codon:yes stop_codon:yes gene_type:complete